MSSQNLENSYQALVMSESECMNLEQENQIPASPDSQHELSDEFGDVSNPSNPHVEVDPQDATKDVHEERKRDQKDGFTAQFIAFKSLFDAETSPEGRLQLAVDFMETSLEQGGTPHFRSFWEARRLCLPLFKDNISAPIRSNLWIKYSELSKEARRLKEILDEQSAFAVEQIEIAVQALENDISKFDEHVERASFPEPVSFPQSLKGHMAVYQLLQKQLNLLNTQATRINGLRKELLKTEMRVRHKNKFFQSLSAAGDQVFPKRKELIKQISQQFSDDVDQFIRKHFGEQASHESLFVLREEIKALQGLAKVLTLNTHSFTETRTRLSECWDRIKTEEKERKKERTQQRVVHKQNLDEIEKQILALKESLEKNEESHAEAQKKVEGIVNQMRNVELGRDELRVLREGLADVRKIISDKVRAHEGARQQLEIERERQKIEKSQALRDQAVHLVTEHESIDADQLIASRDALLEQIHNSSLSKIEKQELERTLKPLRDIITEKKETALLALSDDDRQALQQLKAILQQRKERRQEIKDQLEQLRKAAGSSSLDFEKAMSCKMQINEEKERLEKANQAIQEIETKIVQLTKKLQN